MGDIRELGRARFGMVNSGVSDDPWGSMDQQHKLIENMWDHRNYSAIRDQVVTLLPGWLTVKAAQPLRATYLVLPAIP